MKKLNFPNLFDTENSTEKVKVVPQNEIKRIANVSFKNAEKYSELISSFVENKICKRSYEPKEGK